ncbi:MAG: GAF domain-containing protein [Dehalococcoidia bacterium]|nr:GAF domain-containing protein [Dehalococcoidia bacterium]
MAVAFENARLFSETLERERETRALASVASALALDEPFEATLRAISRGVVDTTAAVACAVTLLDDEGGFVQAGGWNMPEGFSQAMAASVAAGAPSPAHSVSKSGEPTVYDAGVRSRAMRDDRFADVRPFVTDQDWENAAVVPLPYRGRVLGTISTFYPEGVVPSEADLALLNAIAGQAAFAVENARLFTETVERERETRALATVSSALMLDQPVEATLSAIARGVVDTTEALACSVSLISEDGVYVMNGVSGLPDGFDQAVMDAVERGAHSAPFEVMQSGQPQVHGNLRHYFRTNPYYEPVRPLMEDVEWDSLVMVPLRYRGRALGTLTTYYEPGFVPNR